jgi:hypothetical protein
MSQPHTDTPLQEKPRLNLEDAVRQALAGLRYGSVEITVHNARVVQIERKERFRPEEEGFEATITTP